MKDEGSVTVHAPRLAERTEISRTNAGVQPEMRDTLSPWEAAR